MANFDVQRHDPIIDHAVLDNALDTLRGHFHVRRKGNKNWKSTIRTLLYNAKENPSAAGISANVQRVLQDQTAFNMLVNPQHPTWKGRNVSANPVKETTMAMASYLSRREGEMQRALALLFVLSQPGWKEEAEQHDIDFISVRLNLIAALIQANPFPAYHCINEVDSTIDATEDITSCSCPYRIVSLLAWSSNRTYGFLQRVRQATH